MKKLGYDVLPINGVQYSSVTKGESLEDTVRTLGCYVDAIALRHPEVGSAQRAARYPPFQLLMPGMVQENIPHRHWRIYIQSGGSLAG